jgi:hypothetical protein
MGGTGSGWYWRYDKKETTADYRCIDIRQWQRKGLLSHPLSFNWHWSCKGKIIASINVRSESNSLILNYYHQSEANDWDAKKYPILLTTTPCHFGGSRPWFICPTSNCNRRVAILYSGDIFACRHCYQLAYPSQSETPYDRTARRANKIRDKLDWDPGILNRKGLKPKGMHWKTFKALTFQHDAFASQTITLMNERLKGSGKSLDDWT